MGSIQRRKGHNWEREIVHRLKERGWNVATSRYVSRQLDDQGVDIAGDYPYSPQLKSTVNTPNIKDLLETTAANVIFWRKNEKKNKRFFAVGEYAMLGLEDFLDLVDKANIKKKK
jgi:hypothetical protein